MNYIESRVYLEKISRYGSVLGLESMRELLTRLGNPEDKLKFIHIAGTNGKGSMLSYLSSILIKAGYKTGSYYSPWVFTYGEQFSVNGKSISDKEFAELVTKISFAIKEMEDDGLKSPTVFEVETALALLFFLQKKCDIAILETGLGGREDATNVIKSTILEVITPISMDHMAFLGDSIDKIAREKAGIIKPDTIVVSASQVPEAMEVIEKTCSDNGAKLEVVEPERIEVIKSSIKEQIFNYKNWENVQIKLAGTYQFENAALALLASLALRKSGYKLADEAIYQGLKDASWDGRFSIIHENPLVVIDGAHNEAAAIALKESIKQYFPDKKIIYVMGVFKDKEYGKILKQLLPLAKEVIAVETPDRERTLPVLDLVKEVKNYLDNVTAASSVEDGIKLSLKHAHKNDIVLVCGSLSFLGETKRVIKRVIENGEI